MRSCMLALAFFACGSDTPACTPGPNSVCGVVGGNAWNHVGAAYWIGMPSAGSAPVIIFVIEQPLTCQQISSVNWDKTIGNTQVLEMGLSQEAVRTFQVPIEASAAYLRGCLNPNADSGTITITQIQAGQRIVGSFDALYRTDKLKGTFDAVYCPTGVEP